MKIKSLSCQSRLAITGFCLTLLLSLVYAVIAINVSLTGTTSGFASFQQIHDKYAGIEIVSSMRGSMYDNVSEDESIETVKNWVDSGLNEEKYEEVIAPIMDEDCTDCHSQDSTMSDAKPDMPLTSYEEVLSHTQRGKPLGKLAVETHIHLFGIGMMLLLVGSLTALTSIHTWAKNILICGGFLGVWGDALSLTFAKYIPVIGYFVPFTGALMIGSLTAMICIVLIDCWMKVPLIGKRD